MKLSDSISLTVLHSDPIDEERFREAVTHWIEEEKAVFKQESSISNHLLVGMLVIASVFIILSLSLQKRFDVLSYTIIPVLGSVLWTTTVNSGIKTSGSHQPLVSSPFVDGFPLHSLKTIMQYIGHLNTRPVFQAGSKEQSCAACLLWGEHKLAKMA